MTSDLDVREFLGVKKRRSFFEMDIEAIDSIEEKSVSGCL